MIVMNTIDNDNGNNVTIMKISSNKYSGDNRSENIGKTR